MNGIKKVMGVIVVEISRKGVGFLLEGGTKHSYMFCSAYISEEAEAGV